MLTVSSTEFRRGVFVALALFTIALLALPAAAQKVNISYLTSDIPNVANPSSIQDTNLVNPWGMAASPMGPWWVSDNGTGLSTLYNASGQPQSLVVTIPSGTGMGSGTPSGLVYNASTTDFQIHGQ